MSPREEVTRERLRKLLEELGRRFRHPARLYLSGGEGLVWRGLRGTTRDVDVHYEVSPDHHGAFVTALRELKEKLSISIEEAYPGDFVPLPPGSEGRCTFVERFGQVDVFLFDPYAVALSKLSRGHDPDVQDVRALVASKVVDGEKLKRLFEAILPAYEAQGVKSDPVRFRRMLELALAP
jgi:hypothetical protein